MSRLDGNLDRHLDDGELFALANGTLAPEDEERAAAHLAGCEACQRSLEGFAAIADVAMALHQTPQELARRRARRSLDAALLKESRRQRRALRGSRVLLVAAMAALSGAALAMTASGVFGELPRLDRGERVERAQRDVPVSFQTEVPPVVVADEVPSDAVIDAEMAVPEEPESVERGEPLPRARRPVARRGQASGAERSEAAVQPPPTMLQAPPEGAADAAAVEMAAMPAERLRVARLEGTPTPAEAARQARLALEGAEPGDPGWLDAGDLAALAGDPEGATDAWLRALAGRRGSVAAGRLERLVRDGTADSEGTLAALEGLPEARDSAEGLRLRCEWGLRYRGDRGAVEVCQTFGRRFPDHPDVRLLSLSAGRTAEFRLGDLKLAEQEYSRALLLHQYAGLAGSSALFARSRCRAKLGDLEEAQADLRVFLHVQPEARWRADVRDLAERLHLDLGAAPTP